MDGFWQLIDTQLKSIARKGASADAVCAILPPAPPMAAANADGFFGGSGGEVQLDDVLRAKGRDYMWQKASYWWCMQAPDGSELTYVEGDLYKGNQP